LRKTRRRQGGGGGCRRLPTDNSPDLEEISVSD
jgi:hypothetical protein